MAGRGIRRTAAIMGAVAMAAGCGGPVGAKLYSTPTAGGSARPVATADPCGLFTALEVGNALGTAVTALQRPSYDSTASCEWVPTATPAGPSVLRVTLVPRGGDGMLVPGDALAIADGAVSYPDRGEMRVLVGTTVLSVDGGAGPAPTADTLLALAERAVRRLG